MYLFVCIEQHVSTVAFAMLGKGLISVTFCCIYVFTSEIFPTEVRNVGVGAAVMFGGISNMAAAYFGGPLVSHRVTFLRKVVVSCRTRMAQANLRQRYVNVLCCVRQVAAPESLPCLAMVKNPSILSWIQIVIRIITKIVPLRGWANFNLP